MADNKEVKPHIYLGSTGKTEGYTSTSGGGSNTEIPARNRQQHGGQLIGQLRQLKEQQTAIHQEAEHHDLQAPVGIQVEFESFPGIELAVESLANATQKIELLNVIHREDKTFATIFVPEGKLTNIEQKLQDYLEEKKIVLEDQEIIKNSLMLFSRFALPHWKRCGQMIQNCCQKTLMRVSGGRSGYLYVEIVKQSFMISRS